MSKTGKARGQPLVALLAILAGWVGGRAAEWQAPTLVEKATATQTGTALLPPSAVGFVIDGRIGPQSIGGVLAPGYASPYAYGYPAGYGASSIAAGVPAALPPISAGMPAPVVFRPFIAWNPAGTSWGPSAAMFMPRSGDFAPQESRAPNLPAPEMAPTATSTAEQAAVQAAPPARQRRWSMDTWAMLRPDDGTGLSAGVLPATYGASQSGAVLRYRIAPSNRYRPTIYARTTSALAVRENALALGVSGRPVPSLPLVAAVEGRFADEMGQYRFQPAALAYTELPPVPLPGRWQAETYLQGGYVGGSFATLFADGQARVDRALFRFGQVEGRVGGGIWGGAQKGVARLDTGPSASVTMPMGKGMFGRMAFDWRFKVAGEARPGSGPAMTLSAGF